MYSYFAYGLGVHSTFLLPEFIAAEVECDVVIHLGTQDLIPEEARDQPSYLRVSTAEVIISSEDVGTFLVRDGREVCVIPNAGVDESRLRLSLVGVVMAFLLYQRGILVLHAASNDMAGGAVAFLGESGFGKSTAAAALYKQGYNLFTDDVLPVDTNSSVAMVASGFPQFKLHPEAAAALEYDPRSSRELDSSQEKLGYRADNGFVTGRLPLRCIYVLARGEELKIESLQRSKGVMELVRHSYPTRAQHCGGAAHFQQCAKIANQVPMYRLVRPRELSLLTDIALLVEAHVLSNFNSQPYHRLDQAENARPVALRPVEAA